MDIVFAPLSWEASATWTLLEWVRYFYLRYAVEWALVSVIVLGTFSRDLIHIGYLILPFYFLRSRNALSKDGQTGLRLLQIYNITVIGAVLLYQAPMEALLGSWYGPSDSECSFLQGDGLLQASDGARSASRATYYRFIHFWRRSPPAEYHHSTKNTKRRWS